MDVYSDKDTRNMDYWTWVNEDRSFQHACSNVSDFVAFFPAAAVAITGVVLGFCIGSVEKLGLLAGSGLLGINNLPDSHKVIDDSMNFYGENCTKITFKFTKNTIGMVPAIPLAALYKGIRMGLAATPLRKNLRLMLAKK